MMLRAIATNDLNRIAIIARPGVNPNSDIFLVGGLLDCAAARGNRHSANANYEFHAFFRCGGTSPGTFPEEMKALTDAIDALYAAFSDLPKPKNIEACPCCIEDKNLCALLTKPLRELSPDDLSSYASSAFLTAGDVPDYLYFLPRILDITATNEYWWPDPEVTGRAISNTEPLSWPPK